jgi:tripartite-type tricarboxylate transporter receptor subunit TctC
MRPGMRPDWRRIRRSFIIRCLAIALALAGMTPQKAFAQSGYPNKPIRLIVGFGAGGLADITMRIVAEKLGERLGQRVVIENRPGAGGVVAAQTVASAPPDGYTLIVLSIGTAISVSLIKALPFDPVKDFVPVSSVAFFDLLLLVNASSPLKSLNDLLAQARSRGNTMNFGTINPGSSQNLSAELFKSTAGISTTIVPYRTTPETMVALKRDDVSVVFESYAALKGAIDSGDARAIASTGRERSLPNVPTVRESGLPDYDVLGWNAIFAPAGTPKEIVTLLNRHIVEVVALPEVRQRILDLGTEPRAGTPEELGALLRDDIKKWADVIERAGIEKR